VKADAATVLFVLSVLSVQKGARHVFIKKEKTNTSGSGLSGYGENDVVILDGCNQLGLKKFLLRLEQMH
jgi:hypothetical protein